MEFLNVGDASWEELALSDGLTHMGHNCNQLPLHDSIHAAMVQAVRDDAYRNYTPPNGFEELRNLIGTEIGVPGTGVLVTQGATEAIFQAMASLLQPGDQTIVSDPGWPHIPNFARMLGSEVVAIPIYSETCGYKLSVEAVREHVTPRTKLIAVIDPLNPLGSAYTEAEIRALCALAEECGAWILHDATYKDFSRVGHSSAIRYSQRAVLNISLSKICGFAGLRVGASIAHPEVLSRIAEFQVARLGGNWVAQQGAIAAYKSKPNWLPSILEINARNQDRIARRIADIDGFRILVQPSSGNFLAVDVTGTGYNSEQVVRAALSQGYILRSGNYTSQRFGNRFVRITTTVPEEAVKRFCEALPTVVDRVARAA